MKHSYLMSKDLEEMKAIEQDLVGEGIDPHHIHIMSDDESGLHKHQLQPVNQFVKTDIIRCTLWGCMIGIVLSMFTLSMPALLDYSSAIETLPFIFLAIILLGISTWEGGLWGIQVMNRRFKNLEDDLHHGQHLMIVDYNQPDDALFTDILQSHTSVRKIVL